MNIRDLPLWGIWVGILLILAAFFKFCMRGYSYMAYTLVFVAVLILIGRFAPTGLRRMTAVLVGLGLIYFCALELLILDSARTDTDPQRKYLVVLGAAVHGSQPSLALTHRLEGALSYMESYPDSIAIVSGGQGKGEDISEALCMRDWLAAHGISQDRIIMEDKATSTMENLSFSFDIIRSLGDEPDGNVAIVSSGYHLYRAKSMAKMLGVQAAGVAGSKGYPIYTLNCFIREAFGVTHLWVLGS